MIITLSAQHIDPVSPKIIDSITKSGESLTINGETLDLSGIPDGATLPADAIDSEWIIGPINRIDGELHLTVLLPLGKNATEAQRFPKPITVTQDGEVPLP